MAKGGNWSNVKSAPSSVCVLHLSSLGRDYFWEIVESTSPDSKKITKLLYRPCSARSWPYGASLWFCQNMKLPTISQNFFSLCTSGARGCRLRAVQTLGAARRAGSGRCAPEGTGATLWTCPWSCRAWIKDLRSWGKRTYLFSLGRKGKQLLQRKSWLPRGVETKDGAAIDTLKCVT